jgi:DMSO/TMAO reductase YedYZ molybdopterin-dependent catalytic subunit
MKLFDRLVAMLFVFMIICSPAVSQADSSAAHTPLDQNTPAASQDPQTVEEANTATAAPELYIPDKIHQFKTVPAGQTITHDFIVYNKGTDALRITRVKTG